MNCAGPDGPANTYGRLVIMNMVAVAPSVTIASETKSVVDSASGKTIVERFESTINPDTGATTTTRERSVFDPKTGNAEVQRVEVTTQPDGQRTYKATAGAFDPDSNQFISKTSTGDVPADANVDMDEVSLDDDGRMYLREDDGSFVPSPKLDEHDDIPDHDPEVLNDPKVIAAQKEMDAQQSKIDAVKEHLAWEAASARTQKEAKAASKRRKAGPELPGFTKPKNPGDGGFAPGPAKKGGDGAGPNAAKARKPHQPDAEKWTKNGGTIKENPDGTTTYRRKDGVEVTYDTDGFPDFSTYRHPDVKDVEIEFTGKYGVDRTRANAASNLTETPTGWRWHHHQDGKTMQLIRSDVYEEFFHTGGMAGTRQ